MSSGPGDASVLEGNLARLRSRAPALAAAVADADPDAVRIERPAARRLKVSCDGVLLASAYDPEAEGRRLADEMAQEPADLMVAIGFGLGHHLEAWRERNAGPLLVWEPSPARLRAALSLRPLPWLGRDDVTLVSSAQELGDHVGGSYTTGLRIRIFVHPSALRLAPEEVRAGVERVGRVKDNFDMNAATRVACLEIWTRLSVENAPQILKSPGLDRLRGRFAGRPAVVAAAGPSLDKQLPLLAAEAERLLVIAVGPSLGSLRAHGITPDLVHVLESTDVAHQLTRSGPTDDLSLVLTPKVHPGLFRLPARSRFVAYTATDRFGCWMAKPLGEELLIPGEPNVALSAVRIAAALGADPILLIGQDLAFSEGRVYASGSCYEEVGFETDADGAFRYTSMERKLDVYNGDRSRMTAASRQAFVWVEGWNGERLPTCPAYAQSIDCYRGIARQLEQTGSRLVNCTEGGARLPGVDHESFAEALAACGSEPLHAREQIQAAYDAAETADAGAFREPIASARRDMEHIEKHARRGLREARAAARRLARGVRREQVTRELRKTARAERRVKEGLAQMPWIEALAQEEVHRAVALQRSASRAEPTPEEALEESVLLLEGIESGVGKARELFDRFEALVLGPAVGGPEGPA